MWVNVDSYGATTISVSLKKLAKRNFENLKHTRALIYLFYRLEIHEHRENCVISC